MEKNATELFDDDFDSYADELFEGDDEGSEQEGKRKKKIVKKRYVAMKEVLPFLCYGPKPTLMQLIHGRQYAVARLYGKLNIKEIAILFGFSRWEAIYDALVKFKKVPALKRGRPAGSGQEINEKIIKAVTREGLTIRQFANLIGYGDRYGEFVRKINEEDDAELMDMLSRLFPYSYPAKKYRDKSRDPKLDENGRDENGVQRTGLKEIGPKVEDLLGEITIVKSPDNKNYRAMSVSVPGIYGYTQMVEMESDKWKHDYVKPPSSVTALESLIVKLECYTAIQRAATIERGEVLNQEGVFAFIDEAEGADKDVA